MKALSRDPESRYASARGFADALRSGDVGSRSRARPIMLAALVPSTVIALLVFGARLAQAARASLDAHSEVPAVKPAAE